MKRLLALVLALLLSLPAFAHSGRTDSKGGHNGPGGYHYHHGYPAHQHEGGQCPYDFDDRTGESSGTSSSGSSSSSSSSEEAEEEPEKPKRKLDIASFFRSLWQSIRPYLLSFLRFICTEDFIIPAIIVGTFLLIILYLFGVIHK